MRKYIVAGNWKMNTTVPEGVELAKAVVEKSKDLPANVELIVAPPFTHLAPVAEALKGSKVKLLSPSTLRPSLKAKVKVWAMVWLVVVAFGSMMRLDTSTRTVDAWSRKPPAWTIRSSTLMLSAYWKLPGNITRPVT